MKTAEQKCKISKNWSNERDELHYQTRNGREKSRKNLYTTIKQLKYHQQNCIYCCLLLGDALKDNNK